MISTEEIFERRRQSEMGKSLQSCSEPERPSPGRVRAELSVANVSDGDDTTTMCRCRLVVA